MSRGSASDRQSVTRSVAHVVGLDRLVQAVAPVAVRPPPAGEPVDGDYLLLIDQVVLIAVAAVVGVHAPLDVLDRMGWLAE